MKRQTKPENIPATPTKQYVMDEFGYLSTSETLQAEWTTATDTKPAVAPTIDSAPQAQTPALDKIPESTPAGYLDLKHLPAVDVIPHHDQIGPLALQPLVQVQPAPITPPGMAKCPLCDALIEQERLERHLKKMHQRASPKQVLARRGGHIYCPHCHKLVDSRYLQRHIEDAHRRSKRRAKSTQRVPKSIPASTNQALTVCPICHVSVSEKRLQKHLKKVHSVSTVPAPAKVTAKPVIKPAKQRAQQQKPGQSVSKERPQPPQLEQASHEKRFGDKYVGLSRREGSGRFGSLPLYDDYGDEADAD